MPAREFGDREKELFAEVMASGNLSGLGGGTMTPRFEAEFAATMGSKHAVAMNSAMSVLHASVAASSAGAGDEVICDPVFVFGSVATMYHNAVPVFVDVDPVSMNMNPALVEERISERTKALIVTHAWGTPADLDPIVEIAHRHGIIVIEDCAHALLATYKGRYAGSVGDIGSFSFQASKQMSLGDGGMGITNREDLTKALGLHGGAPTFMAVAHGLHWNYRMNEQTAAVGIAQLERLPGYVAGLRAVAALYDEAAKGCPWLTVQQGPPNSRSSYHMWSAAFWGDRHGVALADFNRVLAEEQCQMPIGYTGLPAYKHPLIADRLGYGGKCPLDCPLYTGTRNRYADGLCSVAEDLIPRMLLVYTFADDGHHKRNADAFHRTLARLG